MNSLANIRIQHSLLFLVSVAILAVLTSQGIYTGDDMGYMYADPKLHEGTGMRVASLSQILSTQSSHFLHFNGRFLIHSLTQVFLIEGMKPIYICLNALAGSFLWLAAGRLTGGKHFSMRTGVAMLVMLWCLMPAPGVLWASLISFSLNYLWPATVMAWLLVIIKEMIELPSPPHGRRLLPAMLLAMLCGALQESFSLPLLAGIAFTWLCSRRRPLLAIGLALFAGTVALLVAPGNYAHADAGGGMGIAAILHKSSAMLEAMLRTPLPLALCAAIAISMRNKDLRWLTHLSPFSLLLISLIICALLLGCVSFTALRQLSAPSFAAIILLGRLGADFAGKLDNRTKNLATATGSIVLSAYIFGAIPFRAEACRRWAEVEKQAQRGEKIISVDCSKALYNIPFLGHLYAGMNQDPFADDLLHATFDANTRRGLRRLYMPAVPAGFIPELLPAPRKELLQAMHTCYHPDTTGILTPSHMDKRYSLLAIPAPDRLPKVQGDRGEKYPFATLRKNDTLLLILPAAAEKVKILPGKKSQ